MTKASLLITCTQQVPSSNLGWDTDYPKVFMVSLSLKPHLLFKTVQLNLILLSKVQSNILSMRHCPPIPNFQVQCSPISTFTSTKIKTTQFSSRFGIHFKLQLLFADHISIFGAVYQGHRDYNIKQFFITLIEQTVKYPVFTHKYCS